MKNRKEKKNDKLIIFIICFLAFALLSWIIGASTYQGGKLAEIGMYRAGLYDLIAIIISGITYKIEDILYILFIGGMYGILCKTESYKKIVNGTVKLIKGKEAIAFAVITLLVGLYTSISSNIMTLFFLVPFIMTVFLKSGQDKLTAVAASFGGLLLGYIGQTFGTYAVMNVTSASATPFLLDYLGVAADGFIITKFIILLIAYVLFNVFAILHINKNKKVEIVEEDLYEVEDVKKVVKKRDYIMTWPTVVMAILTIVMMMIGYISWKTSFNVDFFDRLHEAVMSFDIGGIKIMETLFGSTLSAIGTWSDFLPAVFMMVIALLVVVITNRVAFNDVVSNFCEGVRKIAKVAFIYGIALSYI